MGVRAPCALAFALTILAAYGIADRLYPGRARLAAIVYAASLLPVLAANIVTTDTLLVLWETLAVLGFVRFFWAGGGGASRAAAWRVAMWTAFGLAFLTKGPPSLLPLAAIVAFALTTRGVKGAARLLSPTGILLFVAIGLGWFAAILLKDRERFDFFVYDEFVKRVFSGTHRRNAGLFDGLMYVPILLVGLLPWTPFVFLGFREKARRIWQLRRRRARDEREADWFLAVWFIIPFLVFTLAQSRLPLYVLPLCVPLSIAISRVVPRAVVESPKWRRLLVFWAVLLVLVRGAAALVESEKDDRATTAAIRERVRGPIREVVFIGNRAWYGLSFYLDCEVKSVGFSRDDKRFGPAYYYAASTLSENLAQDSDERIAQSVYLVKRGAEEEFLQTARMAGFDGAQMGEVAFFRIWLLRPGPRSESPGPTPSARSSELHRPEDSDTLSAERSAGP